MSQLLSNPLVFDYPDKSFENKTHMTSEIPPKINVSSDFPHICGFCGKGYCRKDRLDRHKLTHSEEKPHKCDFCGKGYCRKDHLDRHKITHSGAKPHECNFCDKKFYRKDHLDKHRRTHLGGKLYSCEYCGRTFSLKLNLDQHKLIHTNNAQGGSRSKSTTNCNDPSSSYCKCNLCGKYFTDKTNFERHKTTSKPQMFQCMFCDKAFEIECFLNQHLQSTHSSIAINNKAIQKQINSSVNLNTPNSPSSV
ncbi:finger 577-like [Octopus vulgaris]|uniref:Finger 577-like n=2 Tax=Octopus TaxID=6643 RepID=A0AA36FHS3_OCTVU|nr:zinc finger protein 577-like [Octopus sinensis]CAI9739551.1 finger 577-like [Octopus vulgaris]